MTHYWVKATGQSGSGGGECDAKLFSLSDLNCKLRPTTSCGATQVEVDDPPDITIHFLPGTYEIPAATYPGFLEIGGGPLRTVVFTGPEPGITYQCSAPDRPVLKMGPSQNSSAINDTWMGSRTVVNRSMIRCAKTAQGALYIKRLVIQHLDFDGGFYNSDGSSGHGAWSSEANVSGFRSTPIEVTARTGWIRHLTMRNFGSVGEVPASPLENSAGVESFLITARSFVEGTAYPTIRDTAVPQFASAPPNPWVIEEIEIREFHSVHGGYGTMIMPTIYQADHGVTMPYQGETVSNDSQKPYAIVRRCVLYGGPGMIALGSAGGSFPVNTSAHQVASGGVPPGSRSTSGRILFTDNVILGAPVGFNSDTFRNGPINFENNAFLDVGRVANFGGIDLGTDEYFRRYRFKDNIIRLRGKLRAQSWSDICFYDHPFHTTDLNLPLGRWVPDLSYSAGLTIPGKAAEFWFADNVMTTWPDSKFDLFPPESPSERKWHVIWKVPQKVAGITDSGRLDCYYYPRSRPPVTSADLRGNGVSQVAYDFGVMTDLGIKTGSVAATQSSADPNGLNNTDLYLKRNNPIALGNFTPEGTLRRISRIWDVNGRLRAVREIQLGDIAYTATSQGTVSVVARVVDHRLRAGGTIAPATVGVYGQASNVRLQYTLRENDWNSNPIPTGPASGTALTAFPEKIVYSLGAMDSKEGVLRIKAWIESAPGVSPVVMDPNQEAWASLDYTLVAPPANRLPTVELSAVPDVADDKNSNAAKRAKFRVRRSGGTGDSLTVSMGFYDTMLSRPGSSPVKYLTASYGSSAGADFRVVATGLATTTFGSANQPNPVTGSVTIPAGQSEAVLDVVVMIDNVTENNVITCRLTPNSNYAPGVSTEATVLICDGPYWSVQQLLPADYLNTAAVVPAAVNAGIAGTGAWAAVPQVVGMEGYIMGTLYWKPALWRPTQSTTPVQGFGSTFVPKGISLPDLSPAAPALLVGFSGTWAHRVFADNSNGANIPHLPLPAGPPSAALGISGNVNWPGSSTIKHWAVGYGTKNGKSRPVVWKNPGATVGIDMIPRDLSSLLGSDTVREGKAFAVNRVGVVVGESTHFSGETISRPFRTQVNAADLQNTDRLLPPSGIAGADGSGAARSVTYIPSGSAAGSWAAGHVVGDDPPLVGVYWRPDGSGLPSEPIRVDPLRRIGSNGLYTPDSACSITGIGKNLTIVGWSGPNATSASRKAVLWKSGIWQDLNDKHFIGAKPSDWNLLEPIAVSDSDIIIAIGSSFSSSTNTAFVLIPRVLAE